MYIHIHTYIQTNIHTYMYIYTHAHRQTEKCSSTPSGKAIDKSSILSAGSSYRSSPRMLD